jgi:hypothetical protein
MTATINVRRQFTLRALKSATKMMKLVGKNPIVFAKAM